MLQSFSLLLEAGCAETRVCCDSTDHEPIDWLMSGTHLGEHVAATSRYVQKANTRFIHMAHYISARKLVSADIVFQIAKGAYWSLTR
eukprot:6195421-Pleurochrysis_carterae.AAC.3